MNIRIFPPFFSASPLFGNSVLLSHAEAPARASVDVKTRQRASEKADDTYDRLPPRDDTFY